MSRSGYYKPLQGESNLNLELMSIIDETYTKHPHYGSPNLHFECCERGYKVNIKRIQRLMKIMGIEAVRPKPNTSIANQAHRVYPYLLNDIEICRPNHVWCADITYIRIKGGFVYVVAIMDWYSRYVVSWELSNSLDRFFCIDALNGALAYGKPDIFNTDQGSQFTSHEVAISKPR